MKNLTRGKLLFWILLICSTIYGIVTCNTADFTSSPTAPALAGVMSFIISCIIWLIILAGYCIDNWKTPLHK